MAAYSVFWLFTEWSRNRLEKPTPIHTRRVIPIYDGTPVWGPNR